MHVPGFEQCVGMSKPWSLVDKSSSDSVGDGGRRVSADSAEHQPIRDPDLLSHLPLKFDSFVFLRNLRPQALGPVFNVQLPIDEYKRSCT